MRFIAIFVALLGAYYALALLPVCDRLLYEYLAANARVSGAMLRALGEDIHVVGASIRSAQFSIAVRKGCDGLEPAWVLCSAVLAFPAPLRRKFSVIAAGTAFILALNLVRIVSLFFIGRSAPSFFPAAHLELWPAAFMVTALLIWFAWVRALRRESF